MAGIPLKNDRNLSMKFVKILKWVIIGLVVVFAALQLIQPAHTNPPVKSDFLAAAKAPANVSAMFRAACYDCHSDETRWPWYSHVAPISWQVVQDVNDGRDQLNLSEWPDDPKRAWKRMENMSDEIDQGSMPLKKYTLIHKDARLTEAQRNELTQWLNDEVDTLKSQAGAK
jgi:Haem-binding domain